MSVLVPITLFGWIPVILLLFILIPPKKAMLVALILGWLFLPNKTYELLWIPSFGKDTATYLGILTAGLIFDTNRFLQYRPRFYDLPAVLMMVVPFFTSVSNGLGPYDGMSAAFASMITWTLPYMLGRVYIRTLDDLYALVMAIVVAGILYAPFCIWENRMSPQLHRQIYGFTTAGYSFRFGGWVPVVFMRNALMTGLWMSMSAVCAYAIWLYGTRRKFYNIPMLYVALGLIAIALMSRMTGAMVLLFGGILAITFTWQFRRPYALLVLALLPVVFVYLRATGLWSAENLIGYAYDWFGPVRGASLETRVINDNILAEHTRERFFLGWGGWGRNRPLNMHTITDSMWIIRYSTNGVLGLSVFLSMVALPVMLTAYRIPRKALAHPAVGPAVAAALIACLWMLDNLFNAFPNPVYLVGSGGLAGLVIPRRRRV